jgi:hypothetical protein
MKPLIRLTGGWFVVLDTADHVVTDAIAFVRVTAPEMWYPASSAV